MITLPGFTITEKIKEHERSVVYRGRKSDSTESYIIKVYKSDCSIPPDPAKIRREFRIADELDLDGVVRPVSLITFRNSPVLVFEDFGGRDLSSIMSERRIDLTSCLEMSLQLALSIGKIHQEDLIHKDIKPANIILNEETGEIKLTDFGIASQVTGERQAIVNPDLLEGTLPYISPEQTGRMNRSIDHRTDLYSFGIVMYEMLTGHRPYNSSDPMELIHAHMAITPSSPHERDENIPEVLSDIVMKLLSKNAEDRYHSAFGLKHDLEECLRQYRESRRIMTFPLCEKDKPTTLQIPEKLYGRSTELDQLMNAYAGAAEGKSQIVLVKGEPGIGKSMLINELHKPVVKHNGYFISGKFDQLKKDIPYSALQHAFQDLSRQVLSQDRVKIEQLRTNILEAVGHNVQIITDLIPEMEHILGKQPPAEALPPMQSQNRFNRVMTGFVQSFSRKEHPLVLFLDDMQWADQATLKLVEHISLNSGIDSLLIIGSYRDKEVNASHPLFLAIEEIRKAGAVLTELMLSPLNAEGTEELISDTFSIGKEESATLTELVMSKTYGNPFFINQFLRTLFQRGMIHFSTEHYAWKLDVASIKDADITDNVVDFMCSKIKEHSMKTQKVLSTASCIGNKFDLELLARVNGSTITEIASLLEESQQDGFVVPVGGAYTYLDHTVPEPTPHKADKTQFIFLHDRIQQAAYRLISDIEKSHIHYVIGRAILDMTPPDQREDSLFDFVQHLNMGAERINSHEEVMELATYNLRASRKAKAANAYDTALQYAYTGSELLVQESWDHDYELTRDLSFEAAECAFLSGMTLEAEDIVGSLLSRVRTREEKAQVYDMKTVIYAISGEYRKSITAGLAGLRLIDINIPENPGQLDVSKEFLQSFIKLGRRSPDDLLDLPRMTDRKQQLAVRLIMNTISTAYLVNQSLFELLCLRGFYLTLQFGLTEASPFMLDSYAFACAERFMAYRTAYNFSKVAFLINEKIPNSTMRSKATAIFSFFFSHWCRPMDEGIETAKKGFSLSIEAGDIVYAGYSSCTHFLYLLSRGVPLDAINERTQPYINVITGTDDQFAIDFHLQSSQFIHTLKGLTNSNVSLSEGPYNEHQMLAKLRMLDNANLLYHYAYFKTILLYLAGDYSGAVRMNIEFSRYKHGVALLPSTADALFYYSLSVSALYPEMSSIERLKNRGILFKNSFTFKRWADNCPDNFKAKHLLLAAELARIDGRNSQAFRLFSRAISTAHSGGFIQVEAIANELMGRVHSSCGNIPVARVFFREACRLYEKWGALTKADTLRMKHGINHSPGRIAPTRGENTYGTTGTSRQLDLTSVMRASQAISEEIILGNLLRDIMMIAMQNAGASKGILLLEKGRNLFIEVMGRSDNMAIEVLDSMPLEQSTDCSTGIIQYVQRTQETVVLHDASEEGPFVSEPYVTKNRSNSILCLPILKQKELTGVLYLENDLLTNAFTEDRTEVLSMLASQAAISIENAKLYEDVELRIEQMKSADKRIRASLKEKEILLREIHHRVKNNMQIISSMLNLQSSRMTDNKQINMLKDSQNRIKSMSLVHEKLYGSDDIASINFGEYITDLTRGIFRSYADSANRIGLKISAGDIWVGIDTAIPCGLVINELISNILKHAFPDNRKGEISVSFSKAGDDTYELTIADNGIGLPDDIDIRNTDTLGLKLITALSENQLQGKIDIDSNNGTSFKLRFSEIVYDERI